MLAEASSRSSRHLGGLRGEECLRARSKPWTAEDARGSRRAQRKKETDAKVPPEGRVEIRVAGTSDRDNPIYCGLGGSPWPALGAGTGVGGGEFGDAGAGDAVGEFVGGAADDLCGPVVMALSGLSR
jgi:hypothetical protein